MISLYLNYKIAIIYTLVMTHISIVAVTLYLHRCQAHRSFSMHPALAHFFRFWLWLTTGTVTKEWAAVHRKHHGRSEGADDPHSPMQHGLWTVLIKGYELYKKETLNNETLSQFGAGTPDDWIERKIYTPYSSLGILILLFINYFLFGLLGVSCWFIQMLWMPFFSAGVINGIAHYYGYRNFDSADSAVNISPIGILIGGEELHNNHHAFPSSPKLSVKSWEFDIGWFYLKIFEFFNLVHLKKNNSPIETASSEISLITKLLSKKTTLMTDFSKKVINPLIQLHLKNNSTKKIKLKNLLKLSYWRAHQKENLEHYMGQLNEIGTLKEVLEIWERFNKLWENRNCSNSELILQVKTWMTDALSLNIQPLSNFVQSLNHQNTLLRLENSH
jgi:stearoyl-CoA desaturase (delta-9 desaturase)